MICDNGIHAGTFTLVTVAHHLVFHDLLSPATFAPFLPLCDSPFSPSAWFSIKKSQKLSCCLNFSSAATSAIKKTLTYSQPGFPNQQKLVGSISHPFILMMNQNSKNPLIYTKILKHRAYVSRERLGRKPSKLMEKQT